MDTFSCEAGVVSCETGVVLSWETDAASCNCLDCVCGCSSSMLVFLPFFDFLGLDKEFMP